MKVRVTNVTACAGGEHLTVTATINDGPTRTLQTAKATIARAGAGERETVEDGAWLRKGFNQWGRWDRYSVTWSTTIHVTDGGNPVSAAAVSAEDQFATVRGSGNTDVSGDLLLVLPEFEVAGDGVSALNQAIKTEYNDYTVSVTSPYSDSATFTADQVQTINVAN